MKKLYILITAALLIVMNITTQCVGVGYSVPKNQGLICTEDSEFRYCSSITYFPNELGGNIKDQMQKQLNYALKLKRSGTTIAILEKTNARIKYAIYIPAIAHGEPAVLTSETTVQFSKDTHNTVKMIYLNKLSKGYSNN